MTQSAADQARHNQERGEILRVLKEDFTREFTTVKSLQRTLDAQGFSLMLSDLEFHLVLLGQKGYIELIRYRDLPKYRADRLTQFKPDALFGVHLSAAGLALHDGVAPVDPQVSF